nr:MAG TPA: Thymidylate synthase thyX [Caudoviricetes sp.]
MQVYIIRKTSWIDVVNAARFTQGKEPLDKEPSVEFKRRIIKSEHSPLRLLEFDIYIYNIPYCNMGHLVRHVHALPFVSTSRSDKTGVDRSTRKQTDPVNMMLRVNAQEIINISKVRLCNHADKVTRNTWNKVIDILFDIEPELAKACVPSCIYRGFCPEFKSCGFDNTPSFNSDRELYLENLDV